MSLNDIPYPCFLFVFQGKGENVWDRLTHTRPDVIEGKSNGDIATDQYHKIDEDIRLMKFLGVRLLIYKLMV